MALERLTLHITDRCQLNCDHCLRDPGAKPLDLELELVASVLDQARALFGTRHVGLTGGEPTLHPRFYDIVDAIVDRGFTWHVVSNAEGFDRVIERLDQRPERLRHLALFNFSLDGATTETHDAIRGEGNFTCVLRAVSICVARKIPFLFQITLNARNLHELEDVALLATQLGATKLAYNFTQPTGTFLDANLSLPASEWMRAIDRVQRVRDTFKLEVVHSDLGPHVQPMQMCEVWRHTVLHVDPAGRLTMCCQHAGIPSAGPVSDVAGDLREMTLSEAYRRFSETVAYAVQERVKAVAGGGLDEWDRHFTCNWCLKLFGKPHWIEGGVGGPTAERPRWRGAWAPGYKPSHADADPSLVPLRLVSGGGK